MSYEVMTASDSDSDSEGKKVSKLHAAARTWMLRERLALLMRGAAR